jgi:hypothetical protein
MYSLKLSDYPIILVELASTDLCLFLIPLSLKNFIMVSPETYLRDSIGSVTSRMITEASVRFVETLRDIF